MAILRFSLVSSLCWWIQSNNDPPAQNSETKHCLSVSKTIPKISRMLGCRSMAKVCISPTKLFNSFSAPTKLETLAEEKPSFYLKDASSSSLQWEFRSKSQNKLQVKVKHLKQISNQISPSPKAPMPSLLPTLSSCQPITAKDSSPNRSISPDMGNSRNKDSVSAVFTRRLELSFSWFLVTQWPKLFVSAHLQQERVIKLVREDEPGVLQNDGIHNKRIEHVVENDGCKISTKSSVSRIRIRTPQNWANHKKRAKSQKGSPTPGSVTASTV